MLGLWRGRRPLSGATEYERADGCRPDWAGSVTLGPMDLHAGGAVTCHGSLPAARTNSPPGSEAVPRSLPVPWGRWFHLRKVPPRVRRAR